MGCFEVVQSRICKLVGMRLSVRLCEPHLDPCSLDFLVANLNLELGLRCRRTCGFRRLLGQESVSCAECYGRQDQQDFVGRRCGPALWSCPRHQDLVLCVSISSSPFNDMLLNIMTDTAAPPRRTQHQKETMTRLRACCLVCRLDRSFEYALHKWLRASTIVAIRSFYHIPR